MSAVQIPAPVPGDRRHLLGIVDLGADEIEGLLTLTDSFVEVSRRRMPKVPALQGRTVSWLFYEDSTRTRLSFEQAAKRLSADTLSFSVSTSSVNKGESLRDTVETIEAMGVDCIVVRHRSSGVPHRPDGVRPFTQASNLGSSSSARFISVAIKPGPIALA